MSQMIRDYRPEDAAQVEECYLELNEFERGINGNLIEGREVSAQYLEYMFRRMAETSGKVFVAEEGGRVIGFLSLWAKVKSTSIEEKPHEFAYVSDLVVLASHRGRGLGRALLRAAEDYAVAGGATSLRLGVLAENTVARGLYKACGFREDAVAMSKDLKAVPEAK